MIFDESAHWSLTIKFCSSNHSVYQYAKMSFTVVFKTNFTSLYVVYVYIPFCQYVYIPFCQWGKGGLVVWRMPTHHSASHHLCSNPSQAQSNVWKFVSLLTKGGWFSLGTLDSFTVQELADINERISFYILFNILFKSQDQILQFFFIIYLPMTTTCMLSFVSNIHVCGH